MNKILFFTLLLIGLFGNSIQAQSLIKLENNTQSKEVLPIYNGGQEALYMFIAENLTYPKQAMTNNTQGMTIIKFTIGTNGDLSNYEILKNIGDGCGDAALNVIKATNGNWKSGSSNGKLVAMNYQLPISFVIPKKMEVEK